MDDILKIILQSTFFKINRKRKIEQNAHLVMQLGLYWNKQLQFNFKLIGLLLMSERINYCLRYSTNTLMFCLWTYLLDIFSKESNQRFWEHFKTFSWRIWNCLFEKTRICYIIRYFKCILFFLPWFLNSCKNCTSYPHQCFNSWQLTKMKKSIPDMSLP